jgi:hypothetical protein
MRRTIPGAWDVGMGRTFVSAFMTFIKLTSILKMGLCPTFIIKKLKCVGSIAQWQSTYLTCTRPWV